MDTTVLLAVVLVIVALVLWHKRSYRLWKATEGMAHPPYLPIIGNVHQIPMDPAEFFTQFMYWAEIFRNKPFFKALIGPFVWIMMFKAESLEPLLNSNQHLTKSMDYDMMHPWLGTGLLTSTGNKWKTRRRLLTPTFHFRILLDFMQVFNEQSKVMIEKLRGKVDAPSFDIFPFITACALDVICDSAMGKQIHAQESNNSEYVQAVYKISELIHKRQKAPWLWPDLVYYNLSAGKEFQRCLNILHGFTKQVIKDRQNELEKQLMNKEQTAVSEEDELYATIGGRKRLAFLDMLLHMAHMEGNLSLEDIREEVDTFMFEGHDTTAAAANWAVHLIGHHPEVETRLHEEMDELFGDSDRSCTMEDINKMPYLTCVIKETLRLFPSVPFFARAIHEDFEVGGHNIPAGVQCIVFTVGLHRDERFFPDPLKFDPDRFTLQNSAGRHPYAYVPFSAGPRNCIGQKFAMNELKVMLSSILRNFTIRSTERTEDIKPLVELIMRPQNGIHVTLKSRKR